MKMKKFLFASIFIFFSMTSFAQDIDSLMDSMTRRQKIAQIIIADVYPDGTGNVDNWSRAVDQGLGGIILMEGVLADNMRLVNELQSKSDIPLLVSIDGEWGASMRYVDYAAFPRNMQLGALSSPELVYEVGKCIGEELAELKIFANFAPDVDVNNNPGNPVINTRSFGENPEKVAEFGSAIMLGMKSAGVVGSAKHFPGHGDTDVDSHKGMPVLTFDRSRLDALELLPFRRLISDGVDMVMVGHLAVPALDPTNTPASVSYPIITDLLKKEMGFDGIVITDALGMKGLTEGFADASLAAYKAGVDILLMPVDPNAAIDILDAAFESGELDETGLDMRVRKMLSLKASAGMLDPAYNPGTDLNSLSVMSDRPVSVDLIQSISDITMTVVRGGNELPLKKGKTAYLAYNAFHNSSEVFHSELCRYASVDRYDLPANATAAQIDSVSRLLDGYRNVVVGIHAGTPLQSTRGPEAFASIDDETLARIGSLARKHKTVCCFFGNPYKLNSMPSHRLFDSFIIAYADTHFNNRAAARAVFAKGREVIVPQIGIDSAGRIASGVLPVSAGGYKSGRY